MKTKGKQLLSKEYARTTSEASVSEILHFLEDYRQIASGDEGPTKLISLRVPEKILELFKIKAKHQDKKYQTVIVKLMREYLKT